MSRKPTILHRDDNGTPYIFNKTRFADMHRSYQKMAKYEIIDKVACAIPVSNETVISWTKKKNGPSELAAVEKIAEFYGCDVMDLLMPLDGKEKEIMNKIQKNEIDMARVVYGEMCELLQLIDWTEPLWEGEVKSPEVSGRFHNQEDARDHYLLVIRKASFDLSNEICEILRDFVDEIFGPYDIQFNQMFFKTEAYAEYLKKNNWNDNVESKYKYVAVFKQQMSEKLDEILGPYMGRCNHESI